MELSELMPTRYREADGKRIHIGRAERALGRPLPPGAQVHHADGSLDENAPLVICQDAAYHKLLHVRMKVVQAGGNPNTQRMCSQCGEPKDFAEFYPRRKNGTVRNVCRACQKILNAQRYL